MPDYPAKPYSLFSLREAWRDHQQAGAGAGLSATVLHSWCDISPALSVAFSSSWFTTGEKN
jgi:hypothetical protein